MVADDGRAWETSRYGPLLRHLLQRHRWVPGYNRAGIDEPGNGQAIRA